MSSEDTEDGNDILVALITPTADVDTFYTAEVCPVDFGEEVPFPKSCTKLAQDIIEEEPRQMWEKIMNGDNYRVRLGKHGHNLLFDVHDNNNIPSDQDDKVTPLCFYAVTVDSQERKIISVVSLDPVMKRGVPDYLQQLLGARIHQWIQVGW
jgi:hypothetical protein